MKQLTPERKAYLERRITRNEKRGLKNKKRLLKEAPPIRWIPPANRGFRQIPAKNVELPEICSFIENPVITLYCFYLMRYYIRTYGSVYIDARNVKVITIDTLLYLLAIIDEHRYGRKLCNVSGNLPQNLAASRIFAESGFLKYMSSNYSNFPGGSSTIQIKRGSNVDSNSAKEICDFANKTLGISRQNAKGLYNIILEIITNSVQHAYDKDPTHAKWFFYAKHDLVQNVITFTLLDTGIGIPQSVRKNILEEFMSLITGRFDVDLVLSALWGQFRSKTKQHYRGKGLPTVRELCDKAYIQDLRIMTANAYVGYDSKDIRTLPIAFAGTLYTWQMRK